MFDLKLFVPLALLFVILYFIHNKIMSAIKAATTQMKCLLGCQVWSSSCLVLEPFLESFYLRAVHQINSIILTKLYVCVV